MKKILLIFNFAFLIFNSAFSQAGEWVWIKGDSVPNQAGSYGVQGVPSPTNNPPSLYEPCEWTDLNGNFWLFGGVDPMTFNTYGDLWKYDPMTNIWTWIKGSGIVLDLGNYGVMGVSSPNNQPPARGYGIASWLDNSGNLWLFGGGGAGISYNDLWKYDIANNMWTWINGSSNPNVGGIYGVQGVPSPLNTPGSRKECAGNWVDNNSQLWLFGGNYDSDNFNDLWRYNISTNEWTWMKGSSSVNALGIYGTLQVPNLSNIPGARWTYGSLKDFQNNFWLFGGLGLFSSFYNDMWKFDLQTNEFTWMCGSNLPNDPGYYGSNCAASTIEIPAARFENRASWVDTYGKFWIYGGESNNYESFQDLWYFDPITLKWDLVNGNNLTHQSAVYGVLGISSPLNTPGERSGSVCWRNNAGKFYLFGGWVLNSTNVVSCKNDLWKFTIDTTCIPSYFPTSIQENNSTNELLVFPNPTNSSFTISFSSSEKQTVELRIYNTLGNQIYFSKQEITKGKFEKEINVEKLSDGIYFLQVKTKEGNINRKVIINH